MEEGVTTLALALSSMYSSRLAESLALVEIIRQPTRNNTRQTHNTQAVTSNLQVCRVVKVHYNSL